MATISDDKFKIEITTRHGNWWTFTFAFWYADKPLFNPEITNGVFEADELDEGSFLKFLEDLSNCKTDGQMFAWSSWEDEVSVEVCSHMANLDRGIDGGFDFVVFIVEALFVGGEMKYGFQNAGIKLFVGREDVQKLLTELKEEMAQKGGVVPRV